MQVKWFVPVIAMAALFSACGDSSGGATSTTALNLSSTAFQTLPTTPSTLAAATTQPAEGQVSTAEQEYTVASGDYLVGIAGRFNVTADAIALANNWADGIAHSLFPGDKIKIPGGAIVPPPTTLPAPSTGSTVAAATTIPADSSGCTPGTHEIVAGDLPGNVAAKYNVTLAQLDAANVDTKGYKAFIVGVKIVIPCS
ncbi:MAG: LysM peptidoglycan-binding domain-containing protein [Ilumatobacteraceae bacterium]